RTGRRVPAARFARDATSSEATAPLAGGVTARSTLAFSGPPPHAIPIAHRRTPKRTRLTARSIAARFPLSSRERDGVRASRITTWEDRARVDPIRACE